MIKKMKQISLNIIKFPTILLKNSLQDSKCLVWAIVDHKMLEELLLETVHQRLVSTFSEATSSIRYEFVHILYR